MSSGSTKLWTISSLIGKPFRIAVGEGIPGQVAQTGRALRVADVRQAPDYIEGYPDTRSELCVPLQAGNRIVGVLDAQSMQSMPLQRVMSVSFTTLAGLA